MALSESLQCVVIVLHYIELMHLFWTLLPVNIHKCAIALMVQVMCNQCHITASFFVCCHALYLFLILILSLCSIQNTRGKILHRSNTQIIFVYKPKHAKPFPIHSNCVRFPLLLFKSIDSSCSHYYCCRSLYNLRVNYAGIVHWCFAQFFFFIIVRSLGTMHFSTYTFSTQFIATLCIFMTLLKSFFFVFLYILMAFILHALVNWKQSPTFLVIFLYLFFTSLNYHLDCAKANFHTCSLALCVLTPSPFLALPLALHVEVSFYFRARSWRLKSISFR